MKKRHERLAKKLCEDYQHKQNATGRFRYYFTPWSAVHPAWKLWFYRLAMEQEKQHG